MENASKALLIAAGVLIGIILLSMVVYSYNQIANYYKTKEEVEGAKQLTEFNKQFIGYNRENVRGSDLISLVNKIINYNTLNEDEQEIEISITIPKKDGGHKNFYYKDDKGTSNLIQEGYELYDINEMLDIANDIESEYTQAMAVKLAANISTLMSDNSRKTTQELLAELKIQEDYPEGTSFFTALKNDILTYYQYQQFKRARFDCKELTYEQGKVKKFEFKFNGTFE